MILVDLFAGFILIVGLLTGLKEGAVKHFFNLMIAVVAIPLTGLSYHLVAAILSIMPGTDWENFIAFFITLAIFNIVLHIIVFLPRKMVQAIWKKGALYRVLGGALNLAEVSIGLVVLVLVMGAYPIFDWLTAVVTGASVPAWLVDHLNFVAQMLPENFRAAGPTVWFPDK
ncbi:MAG: CvpA family protein [Chloroflexota bacterium]